ncbi:MAG: M13 family metallopeptidase [Deltaproteobacteria bacterium]|nr:M13 family metallopeptidase [Deltaproteobacteria bacterium]
MRRVLACVVLVACSSSSKSPDPGSAAPAPPPKQAPGSAIKALPRAGVERAAMDTTVAPGDDFYAYANGAWDRSISIPADRSSYGAGAIVSELTAKRNRELVEAARTAAAGTEARKVGDYFTAFMDEAGIENKGIAPIKAELDEIAAIADAKGLARALGASLRADVDAINNTHLHTANVFGVWIAQDFDDPSRYSAFLLQGGLAMPDRDYYLDASPRMVKIREDYTKHVAALLALAGIPDAPAKAARIVALETKIAKTHATREQTSVVKDGNNHWAVKDLATKAPGLDWDAFLAAAGLDKEPHLVMWHPGAATGLAALVRSEPLAAWKEYLAYQVITGAAPYLPKAFVAERFAFHDGILSGTPKQAERWKRAIDGVNGALSHALGKLYVQKYFPPSEKARAEEMVRNELAAFSRRIDQLAWMTPATKQKAKAKLAVLKVGVGYPDKWRDYGALAIAPDDALGNARRASQHEYRRNLAKLGTPVDRTEWVMEPQLVNAVNLPAMNAMNFPAAILQPPYFDPSRPVAMDYGAIGMVIGHEISHSFDDQGALFDATGKLANWWTREDFDHFEASGKQLVAQYDAYKPLPDAAINGKLTLGENIADVAGLAVAYDAYKLAGDAPTVDGFTGDQQFFLSFAQVWRTKYREPALRKRILTDGHSPGPWRARTARNLDAWYAAFDVKAGELFLPPAERVRIW